MTRKKLRFLLAAYWGVMHPRKTPRMLNLTKFLIISIALSFSISCFAADSDYRCKIEHVMKASINDYEENENIKTYYIGKEFSVDRKSGIMVGILKNSYVTTPQVIDYGSTENSYKVVTTMSTDQGVGAGSNIYALTIEEYIETVKKPFVFLQNSKVFYGYCIHI